MREGLTLWATFLAVVSLRFPETPGTGTEPGNLPILIVVSLLAVAIGWNTVRLWLDVKKLLYAPSPEQQVAHDGDVDRDAKHTPM